MFEDDGQQTPDYFLDLRIKKKEAWKQEFNPKPHNQDRDCYSGVNLGKENARGSYRKLEPASYLAF